MRLAAAMVLVVACGEGPVTAVDVRIDADACTAAAAERLVVRVLDGEGTEVEVFDADVAGEDAELTFPTGVRVVPRGGDATRRWHVEATVLGGGDVPIAYQRARGGYARDAIGATDLLFDDACLGIECPSGETCVDALCVADAAPATRTRHEARATCPPLAFVDGTSGMDAEGCGEWDGPCATIRRAVGDFLAPGVGGVIHVRGGATYTGSTNDVFVLSDELHQGTATAPVVVRAWPGTGAPVIDGMGMTSHGIVLNMAYVVFDGLTVRRALRHGITMNQPPTHDIVVRRCEFSENGSATAGPFDNASGIEINNGASNILVEDTILRDSIRPAMQEHGDGLYMNAGTGLTVRRCRVLSNDGYGIFVSGADGLVVEDTVINDTGADGFRAGADGPIRLERLRVCGSGLAGIAVTGAEQTLISHVSAVDNDMRGIVFFGDGPVTHEGNLVAMNEAIGVESAAATQVVDGFNLYFDNPTPFTGFVPDRPETHVLEDPLLTGIETCDLQLAAGSPARGAGPDGTNIGAR